MNEIPGNIRFDRGIELIVDSDFIAPARLPEDTGFMAGDTRIREELPKILLPPTVEQSVLDSVRPEVKDRNLLTPPGFRAAHDGSQRELKERQSKFPAGSKEHEKLGKLSEFLNEKQDLTNLLNQLRALLQRA